MNYISFAFVAFVACLLAVYALTPNKYKWVVLLVFSLIFYASSGLDKLAFVLGTSVVVYAASRRMQSIWREYDKFAKKRKYSPEEKKQIKQQYTRRSKRVLMLALLVSVGVLCWCKFSLKAVGLYNSLTGSSVALKIIVPLGISYYTFSSVGYLVDIHWRTVEAEKNYAKLLLCMIYFPHVVEGPIAKYEDLFPQLDKLTFPDYDRFCKGLQLVLWGLVKKLVIADRLGIFVKAVFSNASNTGGIAIFIGCIFAAFQMYGDFSGCMDIITGISDIIGIKLAKNFNHPFLSRTVSEFWRRWHISLFNWLKDYIYMPILMSSASARIRKAAKKVFSTKTTKSILTIIPTACVFLIIGIWHSVGWQYIIHGLYWTILFVLSTMLEDRLKAITSRLRIDTESALWHCFQTVRTFILYAVSYITFTPKSIQDSIIACKQLFTDIRPWALWDASLYSYGLDQRNFHLAVLLIIFLMIVDVIQERCNIRDVIAKHGLAARWAVYLIGIFVVMIFGIYGPAYEPSAFIYAQF